MNAKSKSLNLLQELAHGTRDDRVACTLSLNKMNYSQLQRISKDSGIKVSHILDSLIENFLADIARLNPGEVKAALRAIKDAVDEKKSK